jgi:mRNA-degrading endonuclease RelE of RelBE toxin-antitoxin system
MEVLFLKSFLKDPKKLKDKKLKSQVKSSRLELESTEDLNNIGNIKKLTGHANGCRCKIGYYRVGFFYDGITV